MDQVLLDNYSSYLPTDKSVRVLDFGCGSGRMMQFLTDLGYTNLIGVDIDDDTLRMMPEALKSKTKHVADPIEFLKQNTLSFDVIILKDVVYYYKKSDLVILAQLLGQSLKSNGVMLVEIFNGALLTANYTAHKDIGIQTMLTETSLFSFLKLASLQNINVFGQIQNKLSLKYKLLRSLWISILKLIYILERGIGKENPKIWTKSIIAVGYKK